MSEVFSSIPNAFNEADASIRYIKYSLIAGIAIFLLLVLYCRHNSSFWGIGSSRKAIFLIRIIVIIELFIILPLLYCKVSIGPPVVLHAMTVYNSRGDTWLYDWGRPVLGIVVVASGAFGDMHVYLRLFTIFGCAQQIIMDGLSEFQVRQYYYQVLDHGAPLGFYTLKALQLYYWRDLLSLGLCFLLCLMVCYLSSILGWSTSPFYSYALVVGGELDRCEVMRQQRQNRNAGIAQMEQESLLLERRAVEKQTRLQQQSEERLRNRAVNANAFESLQRQFGGDEFIVHGDSDHDLEQGDHSP